MKSVFVPLLSLVVVLVLTVAAIEPPKALTCEQTKSLVTPCLDFLTSKTNTPSTPCCEGFNEVIFSAPTKEEKRATCNCLKEAASHIPNLDNDKANKLPKVCNFDLDNLISKDFDCEKIINNKP
ncbi:hypothetical protein PHAVU_008G198900 [Phaseolus vulgaris]|uniref:Non-specific lipid-transfer protein n=1 Tax=Phaseolus vulgaris TaxID=3885 RepID=V7B6D3_PHAVU|nr:hypothetical protein PHAVU_008G198900g [Phaseolus vulgaris]ESW13467.1 hypothetical protein PHAVU_008G198900g [Phaseolus vulgaris]